MFGVKLGFQGVSELLNIHPLFVHFSIALLSASIALYVGGAILKKEQFLTAGKWNLLLGALSSIATVWTGLKAAETVQHGGGTHEIMMTHQYLGFTVLALSLGLSLWIFLSKANIPAKGKGLFMILLILMGGLLAQGADLGGRMVFLNGVGVGRKSMVQEIPGHEHGEHGDHHPAAKDAAQDHGAHSHGDHVH